ncbi:MAG: crossover junction endodeoxyribonuclease RuvC [Patescibacteria group bacterium]|nr:crossover junction endodeoxyribonuclease RuvC [Patescibacteria group bacterium]
MLILGLDPGVATTGYGIIEKKDRRILPKEWGVIATPAQLPLAERLEIVATDLGMLLKKFRPDMAVVETIFFAKNTKTAIAVAHARGVILLALQKQDVPIKELTPLQVKQRITTYGKASKHQVQTMVKTLLNLKTLPAPDDAADALALAICGSVKYPNR